MVAWLSGMEVNEVEVAVVYGEVFVVEKVEPVKAGSLVEGRRDITDCGAEERERVGGSRDSTG